MRRNTTFQEHLANAEASTSGAVAIDLTKENKLEEPFLFCGIHVGADLESNVMVHTRDKAFCVEWATHVLPTLLPSLSTFANKDAMKEYLIYGMSIASPPNHPCVDVLQRALDLL
eukprot:Phypoly_transcript_25296.p1 GENE.Phypoly_transcript_25296~~Phypoly_transcript_25296.p1  ORF type:complete len:115 (+),score=8.14 Phypoly_transcript_25296:134-478(+)